MSTRCEKQREKFEQRSKFIYPSIAIAVMSLKIIELYFFLFLVAKMMPDAIVEMGSGPFSLESPWWV